MKTKLFILSGFLTMCLFFVLSGCNDSTIETKDISIADDSSQNLRLRVSAPDQIESILVEAKAVDVDLQSSNSFKILENKKVIYRDEFSQSDEVILAIKPGKVQVKVYAFSDIIPVSGNTELDSALYYGTAETEVGEGEETLVVVDMAIAINVEILDPRIAKEGDDYILRFDTSVNLPEDISVDVLFNSASPDYLEYGASQNQKISVESSGSQHEINLGNSVKPFFTSISISSRKENGIYNASSQVFCGDDCGYAPLAVYDREISLLNNTDLSGGVQLTWKTTTKSGNSFYFSNSAFDSVFIQRMFYTGYPLENTGIYHLNVGTVFDPDDPPVENNGKTVGMINSDNLSDSTAPEVFFKDLDTVWTMPFAQSFGEGTFGQIYPNAVDCVDNLNRLGQDCSRIPRVLKHFIENGNLILEIYLNESSQELQMEFFRRDDGTLGEPVKTITLELDLSTLSNGIVQTEGINYAEILPDLTTKYFARVKNDEFNSNLLDLTVPAWVDHADTESAIELPDEESIQMVSKEGSVYFSLNLEKDVACAIGLEGADYLPNLMEGYLLEEENLQLITSTIEDLRPIGISASLGQITDKEMLTNQEQESDMSSDYLDLLILRSREVTKKMVVTPTKSGKYYLKIHNPTSDDLYFIVHKN